MVMYKNHKSHLFPINCRKLIFERLYLVPHWDGKKLGPTTDSATAWSFLYKIYPGHPELWGNVFDSMKSISELGKIKSTATYTRKLNLHYHYIKWKPQHWWVYTSKAWRRKFGSTFQFHKSSSPTPLPLPNLTYPWTTQSMAPKHTTPLCSGFQPQCPGHLGSKTTHEDQPQD